jgi:hypothetical protein
MKKVFFVHALIIFTIFCFFVDETIKVKVSACFFEITNFENPSRFKDPKQEAACDYLKSYRKPPVTS